MAYTPTIYKEIKIEDAGGGSPDTYNLHLVEGQEITVEEVSTQVEDGQTLVDRYDVSFSLTSYDSDILDDARINTSSVESFTRAKLTLVGATGASSLAIDGIIINGNRIYDQNRIAARLTGSKAGTSIDVVTVIAPD
jgi:hypothetical protein